MPFDNIYSFMDIVSTNLYTILLTIFILMELYAFAILNILFSYLMKICLIRILYDQIFTAFVNVS